MDRRRFLLTSLAGAVAAPLAAEAQQVGKVPTVGFLVSQSEALAGAPLAASDLPSLRRLLRDQDAGVRLHAAGIVIELAVGSR